MEYSEAAGAELIDYNGPGFYLTFFVPAPMPHNLDSHLNYDGGAAAVGYCSLLVPHRLVDGQATKWCELAQRHPIPVGVLFTFGALVCGFFGIALGTAKFGEAISWKVVATWPQRSSDSMALALVIWLLALCGYFCRRAFILAQQSLRPVR
jgi:hypothetical protein